MTGRWWGRIAAFARLSKLHFTFSGVLLYLLGTAAAAYDGHALDRRVAIAGFFAVLFTEWVIHYANEYYDLAADQANPNPRPLSGGSRVLVRGLLPPWVALAAALTCAGLAVALALLLWLGFGTGPLTVPLFALGVWVTWSYSGPPLRLQYRGLGEFSVALWVAALTLSIVYYLHAGRLDVLPLLLAGPPSCIGLAVMLIIEFPDVVGDAAADKRTLVVLWGGRRAALLHNLGLAATYLALPLWVAWGMPGRVAVAVAVSAPLAVWQIWRMAQGDWARPDRWTSLAVWDLVLSGLVAGGEALALL